jgi:hypothetical protein
MSEKEKQISAYQREYGFEDTGVASFTISNTAYKRVSEKRQRKGLAEPLPR